MSYELPADINKLDAKNVEALEALSKRLVQSLSERMIASEAYRPVAIEYFFGAAELANFLGNEELYLLCSSVYVSVANIGFQIVMVLATQGLRGCKMAKLQAVGIEELQAMQEKAAGKTVN